MVNAALPSPRVTAVGCSSTTGTVSVVPSAYVRTWAPSLPFLKPNRMPSFLPMPLAAHCCAVANGSPPPSCRKRMVSALFSLRPHGPSITATAFGAAPVELHPYG